MGMTNRKGINKTREVEMKAGIIYILGIIKHTCNHKINYSYKTLTFITNY